jgi:UDP-2-acetamido-2,6-beta-L-arabino-hexul-4-ose reductase
MKIEKILITGSRGFVGKNLKNLLSAKEGISVLEYHRDNTEDELKKKVNEADCIVHLAGVNRPIDEEEFDKVNFGLTDRIICILKELRKDIPIIFSSSTQVTNNNPYGKSKLKAEVALQSMEDVQENNIYILRLPGIFGHGCKPNYNSVVATFCNNIQENLAIEIHDPDKVLYLLYIQDLINHIGILIRDLPDFENPITLGPVHEISLEDLARSLKEFKHYNSLNKPVKLETPLRLALYDTYQSYIK